MPRHAVVSRAALFQQFLCGDQRIGRIDPFALKIDVFYPFQMVFQHTLQPVLQLRGHCTHIGHQRRQDTGSPVPVVHRLTGNAASGGHIHEMPLIEQRFDPFKDGIKYRRIRVGFGKIPGGTMEHMQENAELLIQHRAIATVVGNAFMLDVGAVLPETVVGTIDRRIGVVGIFQNGFHVGGALIHSLRIGIQRRDHGRGRRLVQQIRARHRRRRGQNAGSRAALVVSRYIPRNSRQIFCKLLLRHFVSQQKQRLEEALRNPDFPGIPVAVERGVFVVIPLVQQVVGRQQLAQDIRVLIIYAAIDAVCFGDVQQAFKRAADRVKLLPGGNRGVLCAVHLRPVVAGVHGQILPEQIRFLGTVCFFDQGAVMRLGSVVNLGDIRLDILIARICQAACQIRIPKSPDLGKRLGVRIVRDKKHRFWLHRDHDRKRFIRFPQVAGQCLRVKRRSNGVCTGRRFVIVPEIPDSRDFDRGPILQYGFQRLREMQLV